MADGFTLRDFNKMSEEEVEEVTKGLPGFENMLSNLKKKDEGEKPTGSFFTQAYGTLPSKIEGVKNPYAGTTIFDPKAKPLEENDPRKYYQYDPRADSLPGPQTQSAFDAISGSGELGLQALFGASGALADSPLSPFLPTGILGWLGDKANPDTQQILKDLVSKDSTVPIYKGQGDSIFPGKGISDRLKNATIQANEINKKGSLKSQIAKEFINPINYTPLGLGSFGKAGFSILGAAPKLVDNPAVFKSLIMKIPDVVASNKEAAPMFQQARLELLEATMNKPMNIEGIPEGALFENDFKFWLNMSNDEIIDTTKMFDEMGGAKDPTVTLAMTEVDGMLKRLVDLGLVQKTGKYTFKKRVTSGSPQALEILKNFGKNFNVSGGSGSPNLVYDLPNLNDVIRDIVSIENPTLANIAQKVPINPSVGATTKVEKAVIAYLRQESSVDQLIEVTLQAGLDSHASYKKLFNRIPAGIGRMPIEIDKDGIVEGTGTAWNDVFSDPSAFADNLSDEARAYIDDYAAIADQIENLRLSHGLKPIAKGRDEGMYYIPRQVETIDQINLLKKSDPHKNRVYETATEAMFGKYDPKTGTYTQQKTYLSDPRETLKVHLKTMYRDIQDDQLSRYLVDNNIGINVTDVLEEVAPNIAARFDKATKKVSATKKRLASLRAKLPLDPFEVDPSLMKPSKLDWNQRKLKGYQSLINEIEDTVKQLGKDEAELKRAKTIRTKKLQEIKNSTALAGNLFGEAKDTIDVTFWRNKMFVKDDYDKLYDGIIKTYGDPTYFGFKTIGRIGNAIRFLSSGFDLGAPFIHGLPILFRNPNVWRKATAAHFAAFLDPSVQSRMIRDNLKSYQEMAHYGIPVGDVEIFKALQRGGGLNPKDLERFLPLAEDSRFLQDTILGKGISETAKGVGFATGQFTGRFQASYSSFLASSRMLMWKGMRDNWVNSGNPDSTLPELAAHIRNMTGGLDSKALGVSANVRAIESMWLAFSPRLLRSTFALTYDALSFVALESKAALTEVPGGVAPKAVASARQKAAFQALAAYTAGTTGLYISAEISMGLAKGHSQERIRKDVFDGLNPLNGSKFLSVEIGGQNIGIGGQIRAIMQVMGAVGSTFTPAGKDFKDLITDDLYENPILQYLSYRGAVGVNAFRTVLEGTSGVDAQPFDKVDSVPDIGWHLFENSLPFALQGLMEGDNAWGVAVGMLGLRTSPQSGHKEMIERYKNYWTSLSIEEREKYDMPQLPTKKSDMNRLFMQAAEEADPLIAEAEKRALEMGLEAGTEFATYTDTRNKSVETRDTEIQKVFDEEGFGEDFRKANSFQNEEHARRIEQNNITHEELLSKFDEDNPNQHPFNVALDGYYEILYADGLEKPGTGEFDFEEYDKRMLQIQEDPAINPFIDQIETYMLNNKPPRVQELERDRDKLRVFWEITDKVVAKENFEEKFKFYNSQDSEMQGKMERGDVKGKNWTRRDSRKLNNILEDIEEDRNKLKERNPVIEALLWKHGYSTTARENMINKTTQRWLRALNRKSGGNPRTEDIERFIQEYEAANR
jgi:hypothetical protein